LSDASVCPDCGRPFAHTEQEWLDSFGHDDYPEGSLCGMAVEYGPTQCRIFTIRRLKARISELESQLQSYQDRLADISDAKETSSRL
jgi:hypothetical protein